MQRAAAAQPRLIAPKIAPGLAAQRQQALAGRLKQQPGDAVQPAHVGRDADVHSRVFVLQQNGREDVADLVYEIPVSEIEGASLLGLCGDAGGGWRSDLWSHLPRP